VEETGDSHLDVEAMRPETVGELLHRLGLLEADLGMTRDVVGEREQIGLHELSGTGDDGVARQVGRSDLRDDRRHVERLLEGGHLPEHVARGLALGGGLLRGDWRGEETNERNGRETRA
jgi:hypothetical protein